MKFAGGNHSTNRLNDYILVEIGTGNRIQQTIRIDVSRCCRDIKQVPTPKKVKVWTLAIGPMHLHESDS